MQTIEIEVMATNILLVDDHEMLRAGLRSVLEKEEGLKVIAEASNGRDAVRLAMEASPDIILMDITMPDMNGIEATRQITAETKCKVIGLSIHLERAFIIEMLAAGVSGYLPKSSAGAELLTAIKAVCAGETYLSPKIAGIVAHQAPGTRVAHEGEPFKQLTRREREVLQLLSEGKSNKEMAANLNIGLKTIETHRAQLMEKLGIYTVAELTKYAIRQGLTSLDA